MKFTIKREEKVVVKTEEIEVDVRLEKEGGNICLMVDDYYVFTLNANGTGQLEEAVDEDAGLQVDENGRIILED